MIDFHTHVLPGIDDGSDSLQMSLQMLNTAATQGTTRLVATPHFYPHQESPERFFLRRDRALNALIQDPSLLPADLTIHVGCELHYYSGISRMEQLEQCCIQGTSTLLLEMPFSPWSGRMFDEIAAIRRRGITPVLAHVERYFSLQNRRQMLDSLEEAGAYSQVNASYFLGGLNGLQAMSLLRSGHIHVLGSDCHNMSSRSPNLGEAHQKILRKLGDRQLSRWSQWGEGFLSDALVISPQHTALK